MRVVSLLGLSLLAGSSMAQVNQFIASTRLAWGVGDNLPAPYTQPDMDVRIEARVFGIWTPFTQNVGVDESVLTKSANTVNFSIPLSTINPLFQSSDLINLVGVQSGQQVTWSINQTFSQTGGYPIQTTFMNGTQTVVVNIVVNNIATTGTLRSLFSAISGLNITSLGDLSEVRGLHSGGDAFNFIDMVAGSASGSINGLPINGLRLYFRNIQHVAHVPLNLKIMGTVTLQDSLADLSQVSVEYTLTPTGGGSPSFSGSVALGVDGSFVISPVNIPSGNYILRMDYGSHLARTVLVSLNGWVPASASLTLPNGDADQSGEVDAADIDLVIADFGGSTYGPAVFADVDQSGEVDAADIDIVISNFGDTDN